MGHPRFASLLLIALLVLLPGVVAAECPELPEDCLYGLSPWRCETVVEGVGYRIWIDDQAMDTADPARRYDWKFLQRGVRTMCLRCGPRAWGQQEYDRMLLALDTRDQGYVPLLDWVFVPLNFAIASGAPGVRRPVFGVSRLDSLVLTLRDGRRLVGCERFDLPDPPERSGRVFQEMCSQLDRQLGPVTMYTRTELRQLATAADDVVRLRYSGGPCANSCLVPVRAAREFSPADIASAYVVFQRRRIVLLPGDTGVAARERPGRPGHPEGEK